MWSALSQRPGMGAVLAGIALCVPATADAQSDFLLERPSLTVSVFGGWAQPEERSEVFDFTREHLTVERGDFSSPVGMAEIAYRVNERLDLALGLEHTSRTVGSSMRLWETQDERPIPQATQFSRTRFLGSAKAYLFSRGRSVGNYAWVPNRWSPYIGGGAGVSAYEFVQSGDFVDFQTQEIFEDHLRSTGSGLTAHALAGVQVSLTPRVLLRGEYRYLWGSGDVEETDFSGFDAIDLSGARAMVGLSLRM